jgi:very-short-patch-repair endonuclease
MYLLAYSVHSQVAGSPLSYKERMHPSVSKAELQVFQALSELGLTSGMITQKPIILRTTIPDFCWVEKKKIVYLDGIPVHSSDKQMERDAEIVNLLELQGWDVLRIPYSPPLTDKNLQEVMRKIKKFLNYDDEPLEEESGKTLKKP